MDYESRVEQLRTQISTVKQETANDIDKLQKDHEQNIVRITEQNEKKVRNLLNSIQDDRDAEEKEHEDKMEVLQKRLTDLQNKRTAKQLKERQTVVDRELMDLIGECNKYNQKCKNIEAKEAKLKEDVRISKADLRRAEEELSNLKNQNKQKLDKLTMDHEIAIKSLEHEVEHFKLSSDRHSKASGSALHEKTEKEFLVQRLRKLKPKVTELRSKLTDSSSSLDVLEEKIDQTIKDNMP